MPDKPFSRRKSGIVSDLIIDCADPERLASFWGEFLGRPITRRMGPYVWLKRENGLGMGFQQVAEPKVGKNRVHFDSASQDPAAEQRRVESLGGQRLKGYETAIRAQRQPFDGLASPSQFGDHRADHAAAVLGHAREGVPVVVDAG